MDVATLTRVFELAIAAGLGSVAKNLFDYVTRRHDAKAPAAIETTELAVAEKAVIAAGHQVESLSRDNDRLRAQLNEEREYYQTERSNFLREKEQLRSEIDRLESQLQRLLAEIRDIKVREFGHKDM